MITISLSPNTQPDDVRLALRTLLSPWKWRQGNAGNDMVRWFSHQFQTPHVLLYNSGRSAQYELLKAFGIGKGDEVIVQAFTCVAVPNSVLWTGATAVYADIDERYTMSLETIQQKVTGKTKAIIVQHTFGIPTDIVPIISWAKKKDIVVIEDCAHSLGGVHEGKLLGSFGDAAFFSFGRDKVISSVFGGAAIVAPLQKLAARKLKEQYDQLPHTGLWFIFQQLLHPVVFSFILPLYQQGIGKFFLVVLQKLHLLSFPVFPEEKKGGQPALFPARLPNALALLGAHQLKKLKDFSAMRRRAVVVYYSKLKHKSEVRLPPESADASLLRLPIQVEKPKSVLETAKKRGVLLGNWYQSVIDPKGVDNARIGYVSGSCPVAEEMAKHVVNLPTRITERDVETVVSVIE